MLKYGPRTLRFVASLLVSAEWTHEGLWKKTLGRDPRHAAIVASFPGLAPRVATEAMKGLGLVETGIGAWVLSGRDRRRATVVQSVLVIAMNTGGLVFAGEHIPSHRRLVARSAAFLMLVWACA